MWCDHLRAVTPVDLVAVVLRGVVTGGYDKPRGAVQHPNGIGELRSGAQGGEEIRLDTVSGKHSSRLHGKLPGVPSRIVRYSHRAGASSVRITLLVYVLGEAGCGSTNHKGVHTVVTATDDAPEAAGSKLEVRIKPVFQFRPLLLLEKGLDFRGEGFVLFLL